MSTAKPSKKEMERYQLDSFKRRWPDFPDCEIEEREEPDFLLRCEERTIGIELTELYWQSTPDTMPKQAKEAMLDKICDRASQLYQAQRLPDVHVSVHFDPTFSPKKSDVDRVATFIAAWAGKHLPQHASRGATYEESYDWLNRKHFLEEITSLHLTAMPKGSGYRFANSSASLIPDLTIRDITRTLQLKESKVERYLEACDEAWLLINSDTGGIATFFEIRDEEIFDLAYESSFARIFLMAHIGSGFRELKLRPPGA